jgi:hypothetical protein
VFISQLAEIGTATYPFMSWNMYGESLHDAPIEGYRLRGVDCEGNEYRVPWTGGALERRPLLGFAIPHAYHEEEESGLAIGAGGSTTDSLLLMVFDFLEPRPRQDSALCGCSCSASWCLRRKCRRRPCRLMKPYASSGAASGLSLHAHASAESVAMLRIGVFALCAVEALLLSWTEC